MKPLSSWRSLACGVEMEYTIDYYYNRFAMLLSTLAAIKATGREDPELALEALSAAEEFAQAKQLLAWQAPTIH